MKETGANLYNDIGRIIQKKWFVWTIIVAMTVVGAFYYHGIVSMVVPSSEDCMQMYHHWLMKISGNEQGFSEDIIGTITDTIAYYFFECSYETVRINWTMKYAILLFIVSIIAFILKKNNKFDNIVFCPIFFLLMIEQHIFSENSRYGWSYSTDVDFLTFYPSNYHLGPIIAGFACIALVFLLEKETRKVRKYFWGISLSIIALVYICYGDILYLAVFGIPFLVYIFLKWWHDEKQRIILLYIIIAIGMILVITKFLVGTNIHTLFWSSDPNRGIYGEVNWTIFDNMSEWLNNFTYLILNYFNIDRAYTSVISVWSLILFIRLLILLCSVFLVIDVTLKSVKGFQKYDVIDQICAYSILLLAFLKITTQFCYGGERYFFSIVPLSAILIIRNLENVIYRITNVEIICKYREQILMFAIGIVIVILGINNVWSHQTKDSDGENIENAIAYMEENGEGYAVAKYTLYARMGVQAQGRVLFFQDQEMHDQWFDEESPRYVVANWDSDACQAYRWPNTEEEFLQIYGEPVETIKFNNIWVHRMW